MKFEVERVVEGPRASLDGETRGAGEARGAGGATARETAPTGREISRSTPVVSPAG